MRGHDLFRTAVLVAALLCYSTILLGGTVMASDSGLGCPTWPTCYPNHSLLPDVHGAAFVEWSHRVAAFFLSSCVLAMALLGVAYERQRPVLLRLGLVALGLVVVEAALGGWVVRSDLTIALVLVHLAIATALFGLLLVLALLSNMRQMPRRWIDWARRASEERPSIPTDEATGTVPRVPAPKAAVSPPQS